MNNFLIRYSVFFCAYLWSFNAFSGLDIEKGSVHRDSSSFSHDQTLKVWDLEDVAADKNVDSIKSVIAYYSPEGGQYEFVLERNLLLAGIDVDNKRVSGPWPLTRWPHTYVPEALVDNYSFGSRQSEQSIHNRLAAPPDGFDGAGELITNVGCLPETPLRYGNVFNVSEKDLLIVLGGQLIVFSPTYERTVFAEYYQHDDVYSGSIEDYRWETPVAHYGSLHTMQYAQVAIPAVRSYAKLYVDDMDGDEHSDVVVWRKVYRSNLKDEPEGYSLVSNTFAHYEQDLDAQASSESGITGEYLPQSTEKDVIQSWLADKNLTWQKGYPSKSECEGKEGELIPQMHDPLLNDPEVLQ